MEEIALGSFLYELKGNRVLMGRYSKQLDASEVEGIAHLIHTRSERISLFLVTNMEETGKKVQLIQKSKKMHKSILCDLKTNKPSLWIYPKQ